MTKIVSLRASRPAYVKFWIIIDNPDPTHLDDMKKLASKMNHSNPTINYFVNVVHYGENKGASYARNVGYNYSNADWVLFLDDDVVPSDHILDAYMGAIMRYPSAKVMVGNTEMPNTFNLWTRILRTSNIMFFYGVAKHRINPPWGVTANLMVKGSRHNHTVQFKTLYPKTGGGEDIDFVLQMKKYHGDHNCVVSVPGANAQHPWWNKGFICYRQICGWAIGDSLCLKEWPEKTYHVFPNWTECILLALFIAPIIFMLELSIYPLLKTIVMITFLDHTSKVFAYYPMAMKNKKITEGMAICTILAMGASTIISSQEITRTICAVKRLSLGTLCRRMDWFDGTAKREVFDSQLRSFVKFIIYCFITYYSLAF